MKNFNQDLNDLQLADKFFAWVAYRASHLQPEKKEFIEQTMKLKPLDRDPIDILQFMRIDLWDLLLVVPNYSPAQLAEEISKNTAIALWVRAFERFHLMPQKPLYNVGADEWNEMTKALVYNLFEIYIFEGPGWEVVSP